MEGLDQKVINFIEDLKDTFLKEKAGIEMKRQEVQKLTKNKLLLDEKDAQLIAREQDITRRELDLKKATEINRQRSELLDKRESYIESEKAKLQSIMNNI